MKTLVAVTSGITSGIAVLVLTLNNYQLDAITVMEMFAAGLVVSLVVYWLVATIENSKPSRK